MNFGWYVVYILMIAANSVMCASHGYDINTWQYWAWFTMMVMCFVAGGNATLDIRIKHFFYYENT